MAREGFDVVVSVTLVESVLQPGPYCLADSQPIRFRFNQSPREAKRLPSVFLPRFDILSAYIDL